tara:strand:- start:3396 stop:3581 length:186 start_codon:yes stop_codon:yes gene_type:complete
MIEFKTYFYYSKSDSKKEAIDKVKVASKEDAITYFASRKKMEEEVFTNLYNVKIYEETKPK